MLAHFTVTAFNQIGQYASSSGSMASCSTDLTISFLSVAITIISSHCAQQQRDSN